MKYSFEILTKLQQNEALQNKIKNVVNAAVKDFMYSRLK